MHSCINILYIASKTVAFHSHHHHLTLPSFLPVLQYPISRLQCRLVARRASGCKSRLLRRSRTIGMGMGPCISGPSSRETYGISNTEPKNIVGMQRALQDLGTYRPSRTRCLAELLLAKTQHQKSESLSTFQLIILHDQFAILEIVNPCRMEGLLYIKDPFSGPCHGFYV